MGPVMRAWLVWALLLIAGCLQSCSTLEKKISKAKVVMSDNPKEFAQLASVLYPSEIRYFKGKDSLVTDTVYQEKMVRVPVVVKGDTVYVEVKCPKEKVINRTVVRVDTVREVDGKKLASKEVELGVVSKDLIKKETLLIEAKKASSIKTWVIVGLGLLLGVSAYFNVRKIFL